MRTVRWWRIALGVALLLACGCVGGTLGGAPSDPRCGSTPRMLVAASSYPVTPGAVRIGVTALAVDGLDLYYVLAEAGATIPDPAGTIPIEPGAVMRVRTVGGQPVQIAGGYVFSAPLFTPTSMILGESPIDEGGVDDGAIVLIPRDGAPQTTLVNSGTRDSLLPLSAPPLVTDGTFVYYASENGVEATPLSVDSAGVEPTLLTSESPVAMGISGQRLLVSTGGEVKSLPLGIGEVATETTLATNLAFGAMVEAPCGGNACWLSETVDGIYQTDLAGDPLEPISLKATSIPFGFNMVADGETLFIEGGGDGSSGPTTIVSLSNPSSFLVIMLDGRPEVGALAVDDACVYFATPNGILSVAKAAVGTRVP